MKRKNKQKEERRKKVPNKTEGKVQKKKEQRKKNPHLIKIISGGLFILLIFGALILLYPFLYQNKFFPGVKIGQFNLRGKTFPEALGLIEGPTQVLSEEGLVFVFQKEEFNLPSQAIGTDPDLSYEFYSFDINTTLQKAYTLGRGKDFWSNFKEQLALVLFLNEPLYPDYQFNSLEVEKTLESNFSKFETIHEDASLVVKNDYSLTIQREKVGNVFNYPAIVSQAEKNIRELNTSPIILNLEPDYPEITADQARVLLPQVESFLSFPPVKLNYQSKSWEVEKSIFSHWLNFKLKEGKIGFGLNSKPTEEFLETVKKEIEVPVKEGKFKMDNGKVVQFQESQPGKTLALLKTIENMEKDFIDQKRKESQLVVVEKQPEITPQNMDSLGIKELVGVGQSNFSGSPRNRRANISLGADKLNGILVRPQEEFSLLKALGKFVASEGWLPELVIKGNKTVPELGGGACQFGTTTFRVALNAGLPITNRQNHSYTVSYYYPIGTDATIYDPAPDFKFINDTGHYLLLQTRIEGNNLIFELWGTKDGRQVAQTTPVLSGWQNPPSTKYVDTEDLAPGETKCTEKAHKGVTAEFTYKVTYPSGEIKETVFKSKYKPWQEVCLKGVEKKLEETVN